MKNWIKTLAVLWMASTAFAQPMSGSFTIDPGQPAAGNNFQDFTSACTRLNTFGILGTVTIDVKQGTYNETASLGTIIGASALAGVTFQSNPTNIAPVILSYAATSTTEGTVTLNGTRYVTFKNIEFSANGSTYRRNVFLVNGSGPGDIKFQDCTFTGPVLTSGSTSNAHVYGSSPAVAGRGLSFTNCTFLNNGYGVYVTGAATTNRLSRIHIENSTFTGHPGYSIYATYVDSLQVINNTITNNAATSTQYAIYSTNSTTSPGSQAIVDRNNIHTNTTSTMYGVHLSYFSSSAANPSRITNNMVLNSSTSSTTASRYGIYPYGCANIDVLHNTVLIQDGSTTVGRGLYVNGTTSTTSFIPGGYNIQNNIIINSGNGPSLDIESTYASYITNLNYNIYDGAGTNLFENGGVQYSSLSAWQTATGFDANSYFGDPIFVSSTDLHVLGSLANDAGNNAASATADIDGQTRPLAPSTTVDIGADEFVGPSCSSPVNFVFVEGDTTNAVFSWGAGGNETLWSMSYGPIGFTPSSTSPQVTANTIPDTISNLTPNTFYDVYIRSICGAGDTSIFIGPIVANTFDLGQFMELDNVCDTAGFVDISNLFTANALQSDGEAGFLLPWTFYFQGTPVTSITVANNGVIVFNDITAQVSSANSNTIATTAPQGLYPFWDDLDDNNAQIYWGSVGTAPNRRFIVQWNAKHDFFSTGVPFVFQTILEESTGKIYYQYENTVTGSTSYDNGQSATIGLKGPNQNYPLSYLNSSYLQQNSCVQFTYTKCPKPTNLVFQYITAEEAGISWTAGISNETNWTVIYGPAGFDPATSGVTQTVTANNAILLNLDQLTTYDVYVFADCSPTNQSFGLYGQFTTLPLCSNPTGFAASVSVDTIFTNWSWSPSNAIYPSTGFEVQYGWPDFDPNTEGSTDISDAIVGDTTPDPSLFAGGVYEVYVRAVCDTLVSGYVGPLTVTMPMTNDNVCGAEQIPVDGVNRVFSNVGATVETNESSIAPPTSGNQTTTGWGNNSMNFTTWHRFIAPASGNMRIDATNRTFNGQMAVYEVITCADFTTFTLVAANDDAIEGGSLAPNFTICGLTAGAEYYLVYDSYSTTQTGQYGLKMSQIDLVAGTAGSTVQVCYGDTVNLFDGVIGAQPGGTWVDIDQTFKIVNDSLLNTQGLANITYQFQYLLEDGCASADVIANYSVVGRASAGSDGALTICKNEPIDVIAGLGGNISSGGQWYDASSNPVASFIEAGGLNVPGNYNYSYIVGNGVCPDDTSVVTVNVLSTCDYLSVEETILEGLNIAPNPTNGLVNLTWKDLGTTTTVEVKDAQGKRVYWSELKGSNAKLDLSNYEAGVYLLVLTNENGTGTYRVVKQ